MKKLFNYIVCRLPEIQSFSWSLLTGVIGTLILAGFFSAIMSWELLSMLLPLIVGINASISAYMLIERTENEENQTILWPAALGMLLAVLSFITVNAICFKMGGFLLMSGAQALAAIGMGTVGGWLGGALAVKYRKLQGQLTSG